MDEENQEMSDMESMEPLSFWVKLLLSCAILGFLLFVILPVSIWYYIKKSVYVLRRSVKKLFSKNKAVVFEGYYDECFLPDKPKF